MSLFLASLLLAALSGVPGIWMKRGGARTAALLLGASAAAGLAASAWVLAGQTPRSVALPWSGLLSWGILRLDPIGAFFLVPVVVLFACAGWYGQDYAEEHPEGAWRTPLAFGLLAASLILLVGSADVFAFLLGWEGMAVTAFLLVMTEDREPGTRKAAWIYLAATHSGALCVFGGMALLASATGGAGFAQLPAGFAASPMGTTLFLLFLAGFGFKAGILPLHFWLPPAHAAAPTHVSSVMSGVLLKMGILGLVRLAAWVPDPPLWWGACLVALGAASGIMGVALALGQHDLKRLLAYHSIENIGIILLGLGLGLIGKSTGSAAIQVLGFGGALLHTLNHALFKGLLFLSGGAATHGGGSRNLDLLGGLAKRMPGTSAAFLAGAWAICGLPPLNGFVSEWMVYLAAFRGLGALRWIWSLLALASLALIGALALACFAKAFGAVFLGEPRTPEAAAAREAPRSMRDPMAVLAAACVLLGLAPRLIAPALDRVLATMAPAAAPLPSLGRLASLPMLGLLASGVLLVALLLWRWAAPAEVPRDRPTWDCGYAAPDPRMQYTASSFADGLVKGFRLVLWPTSRGGPVRGFFPQPRAFHSHVPDPVLDRAAEPGLDLAAKGLGLLRFLQAGHLPVYLLYVLVTLVVLLVRVL